jgi:uroporphyrinogen decarboxylase
MEHILMDLLLYPAFAQELLRGLADQVLHTMMILFDRFGFEGVALSDDYGTQRSLVMSPALWRKFIKPLLSEIYGLARSNGRTMFHHSCGSIDPIIPDLIEMGLDILHPIQPEAMDIFKLKREFGKDLTFCGGIRTQDLRPSGTAGEVREEVRRLKDKLGKSGGYILEPGITVQADVPLSNLIAMLDEAINGTG